LGRWLSSPPCLEWRHKLNQKETSSLIVFRDEFLQHNPIQIPSGDLWRDVLALLAWLPPLPH